MRFGVELKLDRQFIRKDYNKAMLHIIKTALSNHDKNLYNLYYKNDKQKDFTFSCYLGRNVSFLDNYIHIPDKRVFLNISGYNEDELIRMFNSFSKMHREVISDFKVNNLTILKERKLGNIVCFNILSPILVREHNNANSKTKYHLLKGGENQFYTNINNQIKESLNEECKLEFDFSNTRKVVSNLLDEIYIDANIGKIKVRGPNNQMNYIYKAGVGSRKSFGYGMLK